MDIKEIFQYIKAASFVPDFTNLSYRMFTHKIRGKDGNNKEIGFTEEEKKEIRAGLKKFFNKIK